jgi:HD-GYP domain-containing protein (c-di-GMP phosphodiesterase class II)
MYVAMLDRPWLETPFVFQGFIIREHSEIEQLRSHCQRVFVDVDRGELTEAQVRRLATGKRVQRPAAGRSAELSASEGSWIWRLAQRLGLRRSAARGLAAKASAHPVSSTVRKEAPAARKAWNRAVVEYRYLFDKTRRMGAVDIGAVHRVLTPVVDSILRNPDAMAWTAFSGKRSDRNYSRAAGGAVWATIFGRHLGFDRDTLLNLATGGYLLDIGNVSIDPAILHAVGAITHEQYEMVPRHVAAGVDILTRSDGIDEAVIDMVAFHHERNDGSGYPHGTNGSGIPPFGRIAAIVDCYDAMTTRSGYSPALAAYDAARELNDMRGEAFSGEVVEQFLQAIGMFPTGSVVELSDYSVGLVLEQNRANPLQPKVMVLLDRVSNTRPVPRLLNPGDWSRGAGKSPLFIARGHEHGAFGIDPMDYFR